MNKTVPLYGFGSGGASLNFKVVAYATEDDLNADTPRENTIGVVSESIAGWYFTIEQPENMADGEVWFGTGTISTVGFNAIKKNNLMVYPMMAKQMVSGKLVDVVAKSYQNGEWVDWWNGGLFDNGNQFELVTGGWEHCYPYQGTVEIGDELIVNASTGQSAGLATKNKIKLTNYKKLCFNITYISSGKISLHVSVNKENLIFDTVITQDASVTGVAQIDLTGVPDEAYIAFHAGNGRKAKVSKIWLE